MGKFINRYNNYNCIKRNDTEDIIKLSHYTSNIDALVNICSGEFWATDIQDFGDKNEGKLILHRINEIVTNLNQFTEEQRGKVQTLIGSFDAIKKFINDHRTSVLSMCLNINSEYMWKNYARENGYNIIFDKKLFVDTLHFYTAKGEKKVPLYGVLELLPLCNLNCDMCYVRMSREEMEEVGRLRTMEEWTKTAEDMMKAGTLFVLLTGGEPLLYPHFRELYQKLRELGMIITINTNGTLIDEAWADFFAENKPRRINITLYGASNETYERLCHYPGGFDKAVNGIRLLRERNIDVKVNGSLAKANVDDRMKIIELGESLDAPVRIDTYMYPSVRERNHAYNNQARLDPEMAAKARVEVLQREMGEEVFAQYRKIQLDEAENTPEGEAVPGQMACRAGKSSFVVNWQGEMRSCVVLDKPSIPLRDVEFEEAWKFTKKETESLRISARCSSCKLRKVCNTCVAAAIAETGKADGVPEYLCRYTEATVRYLKETSKK